jgi:hypothetical protein
MIGKLDPSGVVRIRSSDMILIPLQLDASPADEPT